LIADFMKRLALLLVAVGLALKLTPGLSHAGLTN
jgi:hypothetical protein